MLKAYSEGKRPVKKTLTNLLLVGMDLVGLANSAKRAGYGVYAADYFGDRDLRKVCDGCKSILKQRDGKSSGSIESNFDPNAFLKMAKSLSEKKQMDAILLSSGLDDSFEVLCELNELVDIVGNKPDTIRKIRDRDVFFRELKRLRIPHPYTSVADSLEEESLAA